MKLKRSLVILLSLGLAVMPATGQAASPAAAAGHRATVGAARSINLFSQSNQAPGASAARSQKPFLRTPTSRSSASSTARVTSLPALRSASSLLTQVASFPLTSHDAQVSAFGADQNAEPPDTMLAAGPTSLLEMVNSTASVWTKTGTRLALADLNKALPMPTGFSFSDPRVLFDAASGRFFFSGVGFDLFRNSVVFVGVSKTSDPLGGFFVYLVAQTSNGELHDQPKIGVSDDKVVASWNEFCCGVRLPLFKGAETFVFEKSTMLAGAVTPVFFVGPNLGQSSPVPAQSLSSTTTEYVTFNGGTFAGVLSITGTPPGAVTIMETHLPVPATSTPPTAMQPGGTINTNDDRFLSSSWQNGVLWTSGNTGCIPAGSAGVRSCVRLVKVSTTGAAPALSQAFDLGKAGFDVYYPAVTMDAAGNVYVALTGSGASLFASAAIVQIAATAPPGTISSAAVFQAGAQTYGGARWGDYSAISVDPTTSTIWAAAEYSASGSIHDWGTAAAAYSLGVLTSNGSWTTYHRDDGRTGYDPTAPAAGNVIPTPGWTETALDHEVYGEPLVYNGLVYVATLNNTVYALNQSNGSVVWQNHLGAPKASGWLCGNVAPQGILGTPSIDVAGGRIYVAGFFRNDNRFRVFGLDLESGAIQLQTTIPATIGTGFDWTIQQQRGALTVANGYVYVPFGGRSGDCGSYHGWVVGVPTNGSTSLAVYETPATGSAIWAPGGVAVDDSTGNVFAATGNGVGSTGCTTVNQNDAVVRLTPTLAPDDYFMPYDWQANWCENDADIGSASPLLISPNLLFQSGKWGTGFLLDPNHLGGVDGQLFPTPKPAAYSEANVCMGNHEDATFASFAYAAPFVYLECHTHGLVALNVNTSTPSFSPQWQAGGTSTFGAPIVAGGAVWVASDGGGLYAFDAATGAQIYHSDPFSINHFVTPAEAGGQVFVPAHAVIKSFTFGPAAPSGGAPVGA